MKNNLHLHGSLGLILIGIGAVCAFMSGISVYQSSFVYRIEGDTNRLIYDWEELWFFVMGVGGLIIGGGLLGKAKWASTAASTLVFIFGIGWAFFMYENFRFRNAGRASFWLEMGFGLTVYALLFCILFFLGNEKVQDDMRETEQEEWRDDILDL